MNNKCVLSGLLLVLMLLSSVAMAELKLGYVNAAQLLEESPQAQKAAKRLKEEFGPRESDLIADSTRLDDMKRRLMRDGSIMSESASKKMRLDILSKQRDLVRSEEIMRQDLAQRRNEIIGKLQKLIRAAIDKVGKEGEYSLIFYEGIAYASQAFDISDEVLAELKTSADSAKK